MQFFMLLQRVCCVVLVHSAALEVELSDDSFPPEDFGIVSGMLNVKWDRIAPYPSSAAWSLREWSLFSTALV